jgi:hypothetical protein
LSSQNHTWGRKKAVLSVQLSLDGTLRPEVLSAGLLL